MADPGRLAQFPCEIQLRIATLLDVDGLKSLRLVHSFYTPAASSVLFQTIHFSANTLSFERAVHVAESPHLADHVRQFVYHVGRLARGYKRSHFSRGSFEYPICRVAADSSFDPTDAAMVDQMYYRYLVELNAEDEFEFLREKEVLEALTSCFKNLVSIAAVQDTRDSPEPGEPKGHIERRTYVPTDTYPLCRNPLTSLLEATTNSRIVALHAGFLDWMAFMDIDQVPGTPEQLGRLRVLHLQLFIEDYGKFNQEKDQSESFRKFLANCTGIETLILCLPDMSFHRDDKYLECMTRSSLYASHFPRLLSVHLTGLITYEDILVGFLESHADTLIDLTLENVHIARRLDCDSPYFWPTWMPEGAPDYSCRHGSFLSLFHRIHNACHLKTASIGGVFTNVFDEAWVVADNKIAAATPEKGFAPDVERFLCRKGPWPFLPLDSYLEMQRKYMVENGPWREGSGDHPDPPAMRHCSDDSWRFDRGYLAYHCVPEPRQDPALNQWW
ncbi:hypothetical protein LTS17_000804 [Exophiala oligosperma]